MTKSKIALLGSAIVLLCGAGLASAQDYDSTNDSPTYYRYDDRPVVGERPVADETIIVRPDYDWIEKRQLVGHINGEVNPTAYSISRPVTFSDLNPANGADYIELRERVRATARDMCAELDERVPQLRGDPSADRECVRTATRNAMRDVMERWG